MVSFANSIWDTLVLFLPTLMPSNRHLSSALNIILLNTSVTIVNRKGDRGSPCLNPLFALTHPLAFPSTKIVKETEDSHPGPPSRTKPLPLKYVVQKISIRMIICLFKVNFEDYIFLPRSSFLIHYLIGY